VETTVNVPWTFYPDGTAKQFGIDYGETRSKPIRILAQNSDFVVIQTPGSLCWSGIGAPRTYFPSRIGVYRIKNKTGDKYVLEELIYWDKTRKRPPTE
jgi:hypothetical protein